MSVIRMADHLGRAYLPGPEGFLRRLRDLVDRGRLDIGEFRIADLMQWLLRRDGAMPPPSLQDTCGALEVAARLALLKARRLIGYWEAAEEEDGPLWAGPPVDLPLRRSWLAERIASGPLSLVGPARSFESAPPSLVAIAPDRLRAAMLAVLGRHQDQPAPTVTPIIRRVTTESCVARITERLQEHGEVHLSEIAGGTRDGHVAAFLACLTLARQGRVTLVQDDLFEEIVVRPPEEALSVTA
jgi:chromatin segregation and condensation protein Rec8/ScpA/Scc1 (kleisin family)